MVTAHISRLAQVDFFSYWAALPSTAAEVDPFAYAGRLLVYKLLMEALNTQGAFGAGNEHNPFWGSVFHLAWQWRSRRLTLPNTEAERIDPHSMWSYIDHAVSIIPLIAALNVGAIKPVVILAPYERGVIAYAHGGGKSAYIVPDDFAEALPEWNAFFDMALSLKPGDDQEPLRFKFWDAQRKSFLGTATVIEERALYYHTRPELDFINGWMRMADYKGAAAWRTDLDFMLKYGVGALPERPLSSDDKPGRIRNLNHHINEYLVNCKTLVHQSKLRGAFDLLLWRRAMRSPAARADAVKLLHAKFNPSSANRDERRRLLRDAVLP
jgi:hypothetical protein